MEKDNEPITLKQYNLINDLISEVTINGGSFADDFILHQIKEEKWKKYSKLEARIFIDILKDRKSIKSDGDYSERILKAQYKMKEAVRLYNDSFDLERVENFIVFSHIAFTRIMVEVLKSQGDKVTDTNGDTVSFEQLLNRFSTSNPDFGKKRKETLLRLNSLRNEIEHEQLKKDDIQDPNTFGNKICECYNSMIEISGFSKSYQINDFTLGINTEFNVVYNDDDDDVSISLNNNDNSQVDAVLLKTNSTPEAVASFRKTWKTPKEIVDLVNKSIESKGVNKKFSLNNFLNYRRSFRLWKSKNSESYFSPFKDYRKHPELIDIREKSLCRFIPNFDHNNIYYNVKNVRIICDLIINKMNLNLGNFKYLKDAYIEDVIFWD